MKHWFGFLFGRFGTRPVLALVAASAALVAVCVLALGSATPVAAQGPSCFDMMAEGAQPQAIEFASATYTVTVPAGTDVCIDSSFELMAGFFGDSPFAVDRVGANQLDDGQYLFAQTPVSGVTPYDLTALQTDLVLTDINGAGGSVLVWLGALKSAPAASATPATSASATNLIVFGAGPLKKGPAPTWDISPLVGEMSLKISAGVAFTATTSNKIWPANVCGSECFEIVVPTDDGKIEAPELRGWWWDATLVGTADSRVLMPAPVQPTASPATGDNGKPGGGAASGAAPSVWASSPAPASRPIWLPLLIRPSR